MPVRSMLFSEAILRTRGEERGGSPWEAEVGSEEDFCTFPSRCSGSGREDTSGAVEEPEGCDAAVLVPPITATTVLMVTVEPSGTLISVRMPAEGEGISASTLSVEISKMGSSRVTVSPTFLSHLVMVPSVIDSPIWGIRISVPGPAGAEVCEAGVPEPLLTAVSRMAVAAAEGVTVSSVVVEPTLGDGEAVAEDGAPEAEDAAPDGTDPVPFSLTVQTMVFTPTVEPSSTLISPRVPAMGDGISASTLSVEISKSGSSRATVSPGFLSHFVRVPSVIDSPIWGMRTSVGMGVGLSRVWSVGKWDYTKVRVVLA